MAVIIHWADNFTETLLMTLRFLSFILLLNLSSWLCGHGLDWFLQKRCLAIISSEDHHACLIWLSPPCRSCAGFFQQTMFVSPPTDITLYYRVLRDCQKWKSGSVACSSLNHFGEKLVLLADGCCTEDLRLSCCLSFL